ncbi:hypothetical protein QBC38DRAFT_489116 [Podospora fimiseda]|uniref:Uncharacterized protein n=1 Tax=Podospora fimiseda TaxID=252190 RepID=A0AAN7BGA4_9PEZI|nr:hypothetical protein QBC38DRAFT_489116 [Podospora fimiseda]
MGNLIKLFLFFVPMIKTLYIHSNFQFLPTSILFTTLLATFSGSTLAAPTAATSQETPRQSLGRIQLEIEFDTFIQRDINVPGTLTLNRDLITATLVSGPSNIRCQAFNGNIAVGGPIVLNRDTVFNNRKKVFVSHIRC